MLMQKKLVLKAVSLVPEPVIEQRECNDFKREIQPGPCVSVPAVSTVKLEMCTLMHASSQHIGVKRNVFPLFSRIQR